MNAKEAREKADQYGCNIPENIMKLIANAAKRGKYEIYYYESVSAPIVKELQNKGFKVYTGWDGNDAYTRISW